MTGRPAVETFFHEPTFTATHVAWCPETGTAVIIDSVRDFCHRSGRLTDEAAEEVAAFIRDRGLRVERIPGDSCPRGSSQRRTLAETGARRPDRDRRRDRRRPAGLRRRVQQRAGLQRRRIAVRRSFRRRRQLFLGFVERRCTAHAGAHARLRQLSDRRCGIRRRYHLHAGLRQRALRLSRRRCGYAVSLGAPALRPAGRDPGFICVTITRRRAGTRSPGRPPSATKSATTSTSAMRSTRAASSRCARAGTGRSTCHC